MAFFLSSTGKKYLCQIKHTPIHTHTENKPSIFNSMGFQENLLCLENSHHFSTAEMSQAQKKESEIGA